MLNYQYQIFVTGANFLEMLFMLFLGGLSHNALSHFQTLSQDHHIRVGFVSIGKYKCAPYFKILENIFKYVLIHI